MAIEKIHVYVFKKIIGNMLTKKACGYVISQCCIKDWNIQIYFTRWHSMKYNQWETYIFQDWKKDHLQYFQHKCYNAEENILLHHDV